MAVAMKNDFLAGQLRRLIARRLGLQEAAEGEGLSAQALADAVVRKQIAQLVAENARATRLQHDDGQAGVNLVFHRVEHAQQIFFLPLRAVRSRKAVARSKDGPSPAARAP